MLLGQNPYDKTVKWPEWKLQAYCVQELRRLGYMVAGDQNQAKRGYKAAAVAKATGMLAGEPDMRVYLPLGQVAFFELKTDKGRLSDAQKAVHSRLKTLGHFVRTVYAATPGEAFNEVYTHLRGMYSGNVREVE